VCVCLSHVCSVAKRKEHTADICHSSLLIPTEVGESLKLPKLI